jgi:two-component sensor histidine kinase
MHSTPLSHPSLNRRGGAVARTEIVADTLRFRCPNSDREVDSGIGAHCGARLVGIRLRCPICEGIHEWLVAHESLSNVSPVGRHSKGARLVKAQSARQDFPTPSVEISELRQQLLDELNHRLKDNLQILKELLRTAWRKADTAEARDVLFDTRRRVGAMSTAQQVFYSVHSSTDVSSQTFLEAICANARAFSSKEVSISREAAAGSLPKEIVVRLALALNELLTNAAEHGADERGRATIKVGLKQRPGEIELYVQDSGSGFNFEDVQARLSGLGLVTTLAQRLHGTFTIERRYGARCILRIQDQ